jgi:hypothetical protein
MAKLGRAIAAGVQSGLTTLGAGLAQEAEQERVDKRLAKEDQFKERQLNIAETDANLRKEAAERQKFFDNTKIKHAKLVQGLQGAGSNRDMQADAITKFFPDKRIYRFNQRRATEEDAWGVMDISFLDKDKVTGEVTLDPLTGLPTEIQTKAPTNEIIFKTEGAYEKFKSGIVSPDLYLAYATENISTEMAIRKANAFADAATKTEVGTAELAKTKAQTGKLKAEEAKLRAEILAGVGADGKKKTVGSVINLDGSEKKLSTAEVNQLINDTKSLRSLYEGTTSGEAWRISKAFEDSNRMRGLQLTAQKIQNADDQEESKQKAINSLMVKWRLKKTIAAAIIEEALVGVERDVPGFIEIVSNKFLGADKPGVRRHRGVTANK